MHETTDKRGARMTSRELIWRAARFEGPERIPYQLPDEFGSDMLQVGIGPDPDFVPRVKTNLKWEDEWGCIWEKTVGDKTCGQVTGHPLDDWSKLDRLRIPDYAKPARFDGARKAITEHTENKFIIAFVPLQLNHRVEYLRGFEAAMTDPYAYPAELSKLLDLQTEQALAYTDILADMGVQGFFSADDWGLQDTLMTSPEIWRRLYKPRYARIWGHAHERGMLTFLHSCGEITAILPDMIEAGLDVIQMDQQVNMGVEHLAREFGGNICFWCPVDIQKVMPRGTPDDVRAYARKLIDNLGAFNGGFIAKWYPFPAGVDHPWENIRAMSEEFINYGSTVYQV